MRKFLVGAVVGSMVAAMPLAVYGTAGATPPVGSEDVSSAGVAPPAADDQLGAYGDELPNPAEEKRRQLKQEAITGVLNGELQPEIINGDTVVKVSEGDNTTAANGKKGKDKYVELQNERTDRIFVILAEFGNERHPDYPDQDTDPDTPGPVRFDGPLHGEIPEPNRAVDNSTFWQPDFSQSYFEQTYFGTGAGVESLKTYYERQSSGRYSVDGTVTDWVKVNYNEARYGRSNAPRNPDGTQGFPCSSQVCNNSSFLVLDAANQWVADQEASGRTREEVLAELKTFDVYDRYDFDDDGVFDEPDGYLDHFQIVHAGGDQADGDPWQGEDAIWSHRGFAFPFTPATPTGPENNQQGGAEIADTGLWIGDYTMQPENGGRSVFFHEYGHDLGLPDDYDTYGGVSNNNEHWTLMAQSRMSAKGEPYIGNRAGDLGAWNKLQLGWLDYVVKPAGVTDVLTLGPEEYNSSLPQALVVALPKKAVTREYGTPHSGTLQWWSGEGDDINHSLTREDIAVPAGTSTLTFWARYNIEDCGIDACDYAYVEVNDGSGWFPIAGSITIPEEGNGIDGLVEDWTQATFDMSAYAGETVGLRFRYDTDGAAQGNDPFQVSGLFVDDISLTAGEQVVFTDDVENPPNGWVADGFTAVPGTFNGLYDNYYIAGWRTYVSYDKYLKTGPYYFGYQNTLPDKVDHFAYQQGLLISYWDTSYFNNNVSVHPGGGLNLYIDAHPEPLYRLDGGRWANKVQIYDAPFSWTRPDSFTLHYNSQPSYIRGGVPQPVFDDTRGTYGPDPGQLGHGVTLPEVGVRIRIVAYSGQTAKIRLTTSP